MAHRIESSDSGVGTSSPQRRERSGPGRAIGRWWPEILVVVGFMAALVPVFHRYATSTPGELGSADYPVHLGLAELTPTSPLFLPTPHPLFHVSVYCLTWAFGAPGAAVVVLTVASGLLAALLLVFARSPFAGRPGLGRAGAWWFAVGFLVLESPAVLTHALQIGNPYDWSPSVHMYLSPTETVLAPFALATIVLLGAAIGRDGPRPRWEGPLLCLVSVASVLAKPSMTMVLLAALPVTLPMVGRVTPSVLRFVGVWFVAPNVVIGLWQTWFLETGGNDLPKASIRFAPFEMVRLLHLDEASPLLYSALLIVVLCVWAGGRRYVLDPTVALALWGFVAGIAILCLLNESGSRRFDGTFTKPAFIAGVALVVVSWRFFLGEVATFRHRPPRSWPVWMWAGGIFAVVSVAAGIIAHLDAGGWISLVNHPRRFS